MLSIVSSGLRGGVPDSDHQLRGVHHVGQEHLLLHQVRLQLPLVRMRAADLSLCRSVRPCVWTGCGRTRLSTASRRLRARRTWSGVCGTRLPGESDCHHTTSHQALWPSLTDLRPFWAGGGWSRIIGSLAAAGVIDFSPDSAAVTSRAETGIMTRNIVKFDTMKLLLGLSVHSTLSQVCTAISSTDPLT